MQPIEEFSTLGEYLKTIRMLKRISLEDIRNKTKISLANLQAIERNNFEQFPGRVYIIGFLKAYAMCIGIKPSKVIKAYDKWQKPKKINPQSA